MDIPKHEIRKPIVSGLFYPDSPGELKEKTEACLAPHQRGSSNVIMVPHGTWDNTGESMGAAFAAASLFKPDRILLIAPVHREKAEQKISLSSCRFFETPLGLAPVDTAVYSELTSGNQIFQVDDSPHMEEHALELTLPFLQILFPEVPLIPLLAGGLTAGNIKKGAARLRKICGGRDDKTLIVLSVNLSRFGPAEETEAESEMLKRNLAMPLETSLLEMEKQGSISSCGTGILTLLSAAGWAEGKKPVILKEGLTTVKDREIEKAVFYAGVSWT